MIQIRSYDATDPTQVEALSKFLGLTGGRGGLILGIDKLAMAWEGDTLIGILAARPVEQLHEFRIHPGTMLKRQVAEGLVNYAMGAGAASGSYEAIAFIDKTNERMIRFFMDAGATVESNGQDVVMSILIR